MVRKTYNPELIMQRNRVLLKVAIVVSHPLKLGGDKE